MATRGKVDPVGDFELLKEGVEKLKSHIYSGRYSLDNAITDAAKAAYLATLVEKEAAGIERYSGNANDLKGLNIRPTLNKELAKIRRGNPEAYFYWVRTSELLM